jgi:hypothetical protein
MIFNFFFGGLIGLIYYLIICQISNNLFLLNKTPKSVQDSVLFLYFGGLIGLFFGYNLFSNKSTLQNSALKIGLYFGSSILILNAMIVNWDVMDHQTRLVLLGINFGLLIYYSYFKIQKSKILKNKKKSKNS